MALTVKVYVGTNTASDISVTDDGGTDRAAWKGTLANNWQTLSIPDTGAKFIVTRTGYAPIPVQVIPQSDMYSELYTNLTEQNSQHSADLAVVDTNVDAIKVQTDQIVFIGENVQATLGGNSLRRGGKIVTS